MTVDNNKPRVTRFLPELWERSRLVDLLVLVLVPAVLLAVFSLPVATRQGLVFDRGAPSLVTAFSAHYVHLRLGHLVGNLAVYGLIGPTVYLLLVLSGNRRAFTLLATAILLGFPIVLTGLDSLLIEQGRLLGFSGLAMAFVGALPVALFLFLDERIEPAIGLDDSPLLFFAGVALLLVRAVPGREGRLVTAGALVLVLVFGLRLVRAVPRPLGPSLRRSLSRSGYVELAVVAPVLFALALWAGFPRDPTSAGSVIDLLGHFLGYTLGFLLSILVIRIGRAVGGGPDVPPPPPDPTEDGRDPAETVDPSDA